MFTALAQALAPKHITELPEWITAPGRDWPFYPLAVDLAARGESAAINRAVVAMTEVSSGSVIQRWREFETLFNGQGGPAVWLYESIHQDGKLPGPSTFQVQAVYASAGLEPDGAELADHASLELAFLGYLEEKRSGAQNAPEGETWHQVQRLFIKNHAGKWLPTVGNQLSRCDFPAWRAIGCLLSAAVSPPTRQGAANRTPSALRVPTIREQSSCTLCGFCVQVCPTKALSIHETGQATSLLLTPGACIACEKCVGTCFANAVEMAGEHGLNGRQITLRESPRAICPACGEPTVSQAELDFTAQQLGNPDWLDYCLECRSLHGVNR